MRAALKGLESNVNPTKADGVDVPQRIVSHICETIPRLWVTNHSMQQPAS